MNELKKEKRKVENALNSMPIIVVYANRQSTLLLTVTYFGYIRSLLPIGAYVKCSCLACAVI